MKKLLLLAIALLTIGIFSCQKDKNIANNAARISPKSILTDNDNLPNIRTGFYVWTISSFVVNGNDMTTQLADYKFDIQAPPSMTGMYTIVAVNGSNTYYGKWYRISYGEVIINFPTNVPVLSQLNDDWALTNNQQHDLVMQTSTKTLSFHTDGEIWPNNK